MNVGATGTLIAKLVQIQQQTKIVTWSSSNNDVCYVDPRKAI